MRSERWKAVVVIVSVVVLMTLWSAWIIAVSLLVKLLTGAVA